MELVDMVHEEMLENPILEDDFEVSAEQGKERELLGGDDQLAMQMERAGNTELPPLEQTPVENANQVEVKADGTAVNEIDWENYLDNYSSASPMPSYRGDSEDLPSLEATLTRPPSLHDHLAWQLKLSDLEDREKELGLIIIGNIDADGYFKEPTVSELAADEGVSEELVEKVLEKIQTFDPVGIGARNLAECMLIQAIACGQDDDLVVKMIKSHLNNLVKKSYAAIVRDLKGMPEILVAREHTHKIKLQRRGKLGAITIEYQAKIAALEVVHAHFPDMDPTTTKLYRYTFAPAKGPEGEWHRIDDGGELIDDVKRALLKLYPELGQ